MARRKKPKITLVIEVDHSKIRKPISPPTQTHKDKKSYNRNPKHKKRFPEGGPLFLCLNIRPFPCLDFNSH
ncbi:hypothetical protein [Desulfobotulus sp.]|uniref:hypothetical protein n=1 Tax=Desulfobotulus sp. TaxID=1940337 RepID=UPI002A35BE20|nr:hypothetical protein [Desulfobotulus sp.]MDY0164549.1 hypothetical protein [Desulfobotulus sp.]